MHNTRGLQVLLDGGSAEPIPVGHLWLTSGRAATFAYDPAWLTHPHRFAPEPALPLTDRRFHTESGQTLFRCFTDALPQRWGRGLFTQDENAADIACPLFPLWR